MFAISDQKKDSLIRSGSSVLTSGSTKGNGGRKARALNDLGSTEIHLLELFDGPEVKRGKNSAKTINQAKTFRKLLISSVPKHFTK